MLMMQTIKATQDALNETVARITPRSRFQFKRSSIGTAHVDMGLPENDPRLHPGSLSRNTHNHTEAVESDDKVGDLPAAKTRDYNAELAKPSAASIRKPSFSMAKNIGISNQSNLHIILPSSAARATASGSLTDLDACIVDMSVPTVTGKPFPGLALRDIRGSLIVAGHVAGPVHITSISDSIVVVSAHQVRIHECKNVDIYLHCSSHPIIEDCSGMRFAPLPKCYVSVIRRQGSADAGLSLSTRTLPRIISGIRSMTSSGSRRARAPIGQRSRRRRFSVQMSGKRLCLGSLA